MSKTVLGILVGILMFIAAGFLATYWIEKMRRDMEERKPRMAKVESLPKNGQQAVRCTDCNAI